MQQQNFTKHIKSNTMKNLKNIIILLSIAIISVMSLFYGRKLCEENHFEVPGTVIGKSESFRTHRKSTRISSEWWLAVRPDNSEYKVYDVRVDFATFSTYDVGSHVSFKVMSEDVDPNGHGDFWGVVLFGLGFIGCFLVIVKLLNWLICDECRE